MKHQKLQVYNTAPVCLPGELVCVHETAVWDGRLYSVMYQYCASAFGCLVDAMSEDTSSGGGIGGVVVESRGASLVRAEGAQVGWDLVSVCVGG